MQLLDFRIAYFSGTIFGSNMLTSDHLGEGLTGVVCSGSTPGTPRILSTPGTPHRRSTLDHALPIFPSIHLIHPIYPSIRACSPAIQPNLFSSSSRPRHAPNGRRRSRQGSPRPPTAGYQLNCCWRRVRIDWGLDLMRADSEIKWPQWKCPRGPISCGQKPSCTAGVREFYKMWTQYQVTEKDQLTVLSTLWNLFLRWRTHTLPPEEIWVQKYHILLSIYW